MRMVDLMKQFIAEQELFAPDSRILLAVSGGVDSVVMADLFHKAGYRFGMAHCNFRLRENESDEDEQFVCELAEKYGVPFYSRPFDTLNIASRDGISVQMAARKLRYGWFEEIRTIHHFDFVATAHHQDDQTETFFINLIRGTGIQGLHGIFPKKERIVRPLLFTSRREIENYAYRNPISWRKDRSNNDIKYLRNRIRLELLPIINSINPDFLQGITATISQIRQIESFWKEEINRNTLKVMQQKGEELRVDLSRFAKMKPLEPLAWEMLSPYGFNETVIRDLLGSIDKESGKVFYSRTHRLIKDRSQLIIIPLAPGERNPSNGNIDSFKEEPLFSIEKGNVTIMEPLTLRFTVTPLEKGYEIPASSLIACLNLRHLTFPLTLRHWKPGDAFYPLGMNKRKKLSDFFIDQKFSLPEKENCWLLCSGNQIVWVVGHRIDHRFRVTSRTKEILCVEVLSLR